MQAIADLNTIAVGFWFPMVVAADAILLASHFAGRTASHQGVLLGATAKMIWIAFAGLCIAAALLFLFKVKAITSRLQVPLALLACVCAMLFKAHVDTMCGRMIGMISPEGDNDLLIDALRIWSWATTAFAGAMVTGLFTPNFHEWLRVMSLRR